MSIVANHLDANSIRNLIFVSKIYKTLAETLRINPCKVEVKTEFNKPKYFTKSYIEPYRIFQHIETLVVYSYRDLYKIYFDVKQKYGKLPAIFHLKSSIYPVCSILNTRSKAEFEKITRIDKEIENIKNNMSLDVLEKIKLVDERIAKKVNLIVNFEEIVDQNYITLKMIKHEYKKYFPRLQKIIIDLEPIDTLTNDNEYILIKRFVDLYSKKSYWKRKYVLNNLFHRDGNIHLERELKVIEQITNYKKLGREMPDRLEEYNPLSGRLFDNIVSEDDDEDKEDKDEEDKDESLEEYPWEIRERARYQELIADAFNSSEDEEDENEDEENDDSSEDTVLPSDWQLIPNGTFKGGLVNKLEMPDHYICLGNQSFENCVYLETVIIPSSIKYIGFKCFKGCINLTEVIFNENSKLRWIGTECFRDCIKLNGIELPNSIREVEKWAFKGCHSLKDIKLPKGLVIRRRDDVFDDTPYKLIEIFRKLKEQPVKLIKN